MEHSKLAGDLFLEGYNCAQAVFMAFGDVTGYDRETAAKLASSFGGGVGGMRQICGAVSGAAMAAGVLWGYTSPTDTAAKQEQYHRIQALSNAFCDTYGTVICGELMKTVKTAPIVIPLREAEAYEKRPCLRYVEEMARLLDEAIKAQ